MSVDRPDQVFAGQLREHCLVDAFVDLGTTSIDDRGVPPADLLLRLVRHSVQLLAADGAAITATGSARPFDVVAFSGAGARMIAERELQNDDGPALTCHRTRRAVAVPDIGRAADRWPEFVAAVTDYDTVRSMHAVPVQHGDDMVGVLSLFRVRPGPLPSADVVLAAALADVTAARVLAQRAIRDSATLSAQLQGALVSRIVIEQAKGVLGGRAGVSMEVAFGYLRRFARHHNRPLSEVAGEVSSGDLDPAVVIAFGSRPGRAGSPKR